MSITTKNILVAGVIFAVVAYPMARLVGFTADLFRML